MRSLQDVLATLRARLPAGSLPETSPIPTGPPTPGSSSAGRTALAAIVHPSEIPPDACPLCKGAGYRKVSIPTAPGATKPPGNEIVLCECEKGKRAARSWQEGIAHANIGPGDAENTFAGFDPDYQPVAFRLAFAFAQSPDRWLILYGGTGAGKTHLLTAAANALIKRGRRPLYWNVSDLIRHLQDGYRDGSYTARLDAVRGADVLLLDEWGLSRATTDRDEILFAILNHRIGWRLPTAIASNLQPRDLPPRIRSRLGDPELVDAVILQPFDYRTGEAIPNEE